jgi:hypothetical protein
MTCNINHQHCQHKINEVSKCPYLAKIKVIKLAPVEEPIFVCFSHLMTLIKHSTGQFLVERISIR